MQVRDDSGVLADVSGSTPTGEHRSLSDYLAEGRYTLVWWHPQALSPVLCKTCSGGTPEPVALMSEIHAAGCDVLGLSYESPERVRRYLQEIGLEYPVLSVSEEAAFLHGTAKVTGEQWPSIPHRVAFLVDGHGQVINRYEVHDPTVFLRTVRDDVKAGPPTSQWEPVKRGWLSRLLR
jgi:peroxiredoxin Q/BCP